MGQINFGDVDKFIIFGGTEFLLKVATKIIESGFQLIVFSAQRLLNESINGKNFNKLLDENNIEYYTSADIDKESKVVKYLTSKTIGISLGSPWVFKENFIKNFNGKLLNMHGTRLPQNRGSGGFSWQILRKNRLGYCMIHQVDPGIDTGRIVKFKEFIYPMSCKIPKDFIEYYYEQNITFFGEFLVEIKNRGTFDCIGQPEYLSIYWPRLNTLVHGFIDWSWSLSDIGSFIDAFDEPYDGASTFLRDQRVFLKESYADYNDGPFHSFQCGLIYRKGNGFLCVATREGTLIVKKVYNKKGENIIDNIKNGEKFFTPANYLEKAKAFRAFYNVYGLRKEGKSGTT